MMYNFVLFVDVDECRLGTGGCRDDHTCVNLDGSIDGQPTHNCSCGKGFNDNGTHCNGKYKMYKMYEYECTSTSTSTSTSLTLLHLFTYLFT